MVQDMQQSKVGLAEEYSKEKKKMKSLQAQLATWQREKVDLVDSHKASHFSSLPIDESIKCRSAENWHCLQIKLSLSDCAVLFCAVLRCVVNYVGTCCSNNLSLLHCFPVIAVLQVQGKFLAVLLHVFLSLLHCRFKAKAFLLVLTHFLCLRQQVEVSALRDEIHVLTAKQAPPKVAMDSPKKSKPAKKKALESQATASTIPLDTLVSSCKSLSPCNDPFSPSRLHPVLPCKTFSPNPPLCRDFMGRARSTSTTSGSIVPSGLLTFCAETC